MYVVEANKNGVDGCETNRNVTVTDWNVDVADVPVTPTDLSLLQTPANFTASSEISSVTLCSGIPTGIAISEDENEMSLFPNPADAEILIKNGNSRKGSEIKFYSLLGKEIFKSQTSDVPIKISDLSNGMYVYKILAGDGSVVKTGKVCIQHPGSR